MPASSKAVTSSGHEGASAPSPMVTMRVAPTPLPSKEPTLAGLFAGVMKGADQSLRIGHIFLGSHSWTVTLCLVIDISGELVNYKRESSC